LALVCAVGWSLFAFAGLYGWTLVPLGGLALAGLLAARPAIFRHDVRALDLALVVALATCLVQLIPIPPSWGAFLSPHADAIHQALSLDPGLASRSATGPLTISPARTLVSAAYTIVLFVVFLTAREAFERLGLRRVVRPIAWIGLGVSVLAIVQLVTSPRLIYWEWQPEDVGARPYGPFVNRNHMATWLLLAIPTACGYAMARVRSRMSGYSDRHIAFARAVGDAATIWLAGSVAVMVSALFVSLSRSGIVGLGAALLVGAALARTRLKRINPFWVTGFAVAMVLIAVYFANFGALAARFASVLEQGTNRVEIWRQTLAIVRDFPLTGTGLGTYSTAMLVYQQGDRSFFFNQAHNHYLQVAAEGGLLVGIPVVAAAIALLTLTRRRLADDRSPVFWARAGAVAALVAVAVQSVWETGLRMPANGVLLAVVAALAVHAPRQHRTPTES
jgi:hypothetical protein